MESVDRFCLLDRRDGEDLCFSLSDDAPASPLLNSGDVLEVTERER